MSWPKLVEPDQADPGDPDAIMQFWCKWRRQKFCKYSRINLVVNQDSPFDNTADDRHLKHVPPLERAADLVLLGQTRPYTYL